MLGPFEQAAETVDDRAGDGRDVERYEQLRRRAVEGDATGWRLGLALVQRRGVAAWMRANHATEPSPATRSRAAPVAAVEIIGGADVVGVLATMALACLRAG